MWLLVKLQKEPQQQRPQQERQQEHPQGHKSDIVIGCVRWCALTDLVPRGRCAAMAMPQHEAIWSHFSCLPGVLMLVAGPLFLRAET